MGGGSSAQVYQVTEPDHYLDLINKAYSTLERSWLKCQQCGHVHNSARLTATELVTLYDRFRDQEWRQETPDQYFDRITQLPLGQSENAKKFGRVCELTGILQDEPGALIDIGCGGGVLIHSAQQVLSNSWRLYGVEPTASFAELAARRTNANVICSGYRADLFPGMKFNLALCCQVLEHLDTPIEFLQQIRADLQDGGWLYLEVPDVSDFELLPRGHDRFMVQHVSYFAQSVLQKQLETHGFVVRNVEVERTIRGRNNLAFVAQAA